MVAGQGRIDQYLAAGQKFPPVPRHQRDGGGQIPTRAVPDQNEILPPHAQQPGVAEHLPGGGVAVLRRCGKAVLRRQAVIHAGHGAAGHGRHIRAHPVVAVHRARHPAAAMEENQHSRPNCLGGLEHPHGDLVAAV